MTLTSAAVAVRFADYIARIQPAADVRDVASKRAAVIVAAIRRTIQVAKSPQVGSFYKGTAIADASDFDVCVVVRREDVRRASQYVASTTVLEWLRQSIVDRYPRSAIGRDVSAVTVSFANGIPIDVVPAVYAGPLRDGRPLYLIPDGDGGWFETSPDAQAIAFRIADARSTGKLRRSVQLVKAWGALHESRSHLSSTYVETVLMGAGYAAGPNTYSAILTDSFRLLGTRGATAIQDPLGISGLIRPAKTDAQRASLAASFAAAAQHAEAARDAEMRNDTHEAVRQWRIVFGTAFRLR